MPRVIIPRRTFLKGLVGGASVTLALPLLESMGSVRADPRPPVRLGVWFWGNGIRRDNWIPKTTGTDWVAPEELAPLADVRRYVNVLTGFEIKTATHPHHSGMTGILSGARYQQVGTTRDTIVTTFAQKSVDQVAADVIGKETPFRSLELGICRFRGTDEGTTFQHLSHNGPNNVNPSEYSPLQLFKRLFSTLPNAGELSARRSVLDAVRGQVTRLRSQVSSHDRIRLEQHTDSIRGLEQRLANLSQRCKAPPSPTSDFPDVMGQEQIEQKNQIMSDLLVLALACDLTRVFSVMFSTAGSGVIVWQAGAMNGLHQICHDEAAPQPTVHRAVVFTMKQLAYFLARLRDTPELGSNLLERSAILCTSELSEGNMHTNTEFPILTAGLGGGKLRGGLHVRSTDLGNTSVAPLTLLRAAGCALNSFGYGAGRVDDSLSEIET